MQLGGLVNRRHTHPWGDGAVDGSQVLCQPRPLGAPGGVVHLPAQHSAVSTAPALACREQLLLPSLMRLVCRHATLHREQEMQNGRGCTQPAIWPAGAHIVGQDDDVGGACIRAVEKVGAVEGGIAVCLHSSGPAQPHLARNARACNRHNPTGTTSDENKLSSRGDTHLPASLDGSEDGVHSIVLLLDLVAAILRLSAQRAAGKQPAAVAPPSTHLPTLVSMGTCMADVACQPERCMRQSSRVRTGPPPTGSSRTG